MDLPPTVARRYEFNALLEEILESEYVYFQPPNGLVMKYPCITYARDDVDVDYADNIKYRKRTRWTVTYIARDPDSSVPDKLEALPYSSFDTSYPSDDLNHTVYSIYF